MPCRDQSRRSGDQRGEGLRQRGERGRPAAEHRPARGHHRLGAGARGGPRRGGLPLRGPRRAGGQGRHAEGALLPRLERGTRRTARIPGAAGQAIDRGAALRQPERGSGTGIPRRRCGGGHHQHAFAHPVPLRDRAQLILHLPEPQRAGEPDRPRTWRALRPRRHGAARRRPHPHRQPPGGSRYRHPALGRPVRGRGRGHVRPAGSRHRGGRRGDRTAPALRRGGARRAPAAREHPGLRPVPARDRPFLPHDARGHRAGEGADGPRAAPRPRERAQPRPRWPLPPAPQGAGLGAAGPSLDRRRRADGPPCRGTGDGRFRGAVDGRHRDRAGRRRCGGRHRADRPGAADQSELGRCADLQRHGARLSRRQRRRAGASGARALAEPARCPDLQQVPRGRLRLLHRRPLRGKPGMDGPHAEGEGRLRPGLAHARRVLRASRPAR